MHLNQATLRREPALLPGRPRARPSRPRVLILLASYNGSRWIREQVNSILAQDGIDIRLVIRDDASTDKTRWVLRHFDAEARVEVTFAPKWGGAAARNFLSLMQETAATGCDFVAFADQDDLWDRDKLARACRMLDVSAAGGYSSATIAAWADGRRRLLKPSGAPTASDFLLEGAGQGCTFVLRVELYERIRQFLTAHGSLTQQLHYHDWMVYALARVWGLAWCFDALPSVQYRQHAGNDTGARGTGVAIVRRLTLIRRGWYRTQLVTIASLCAAATPTNATVLAWQGMLDAPDSWRRRLRLALFCLGGGRRRTHDNVVVVLASLCGWL